MPKQDAQTNQPILVVLRLWRISSASEIGGTLAGIVYLYKRAGLLTLTSTRDGGPVGDRNLVVLQIYLTLADVNIAT